MNKSKKDYGDYAAKNYSYYRQEEPEFMNIILKNIGNSKKILNIGAGLGSYEPIDIKYEVTAVEPSELMCKKRPKHLSYAINAIAENLPFEDKYFDASMSIFSIHQWSNLKKGLEEMKRVTKGPVIILTNNPKLIKNFWLYDYAPLLLEKKESLYPDLNIIGSILGKDILIEKIPIPKLCLDGFNEAYYARPELLTDLDAYSTSFSWNLIDKQIRKKYLNNLKNDLKSGEWDKKYGYHRNMSHFNGSLYLIVSNPIR